MRGIVMEIKGGRCVILKKDGTFAEIRNRNYAVGQEVSASNPSVGKALSAAACLAVICTVAFGCHLYYTPASYVYMDINPSVRLDLNCFERVIDVVPLNEDAEVLLSRAAIRKGSPESCMSTIVSACQEQNYLNENNTDIEVSVRTDSAKLETKVETVSSAISEEHLEVSVFQMDKEENDSAMERHISARRLRAVRVYTEQFGGTLDENLELLKDFTNDEIFEIVREARRGSHEKDSAANSTSSQSTDHEENGGTAAQPGMSGETPAKVNRQESGEMPAHTKGDTENHTSSRPSSASGHQLPAKRLEAIRAYTEQFGGTLEENVRLLRDVPSPEIYRMIKEAKSEWTDAAPTDAASPTP